MNNLDSISLENILLNENAYFYKIKRQIELKDLSKLFSQGISDKQAKRKFKLKIRESLFDGSREVAKYSLDVFEFKTKPSFFKEPEPDKYELKYGFLLILEFRDYIGVIRKNVSGIKHLHSIAESIDYKVLSYFLVKNTSKFEKIVSSNMNTAENTIQIKTAEANDLKGIYSRFGASKQILNSIRLDNKGEKHTVALNTSRVNSFKLKNNFNVVLFWMIDMLKLIDQAFTALPASPFIDGFATPLKFEIAIKKLEPTYVLLRFGNLKSEIEQGNIEKCYIIDKDGKEVLIDILKYINENEKLYKLQKTNSHIYQNGTLKVNINKQSISISDDDLKSIILDYGNGETLTVNQYINYGNNYIINFNEIEYVYSHGKIFKDTKLLGDLDNFFETFIPYKEIENIKSEKGLTFTASMTSFENTSLFDFIEKHLTTNSKCLICDDMGVEWGDFISINKEDISFFHAKYNKSGLSASNLEEVFGQAQKNFGSLELTTEMIDYRKKRWLTDYKLKKVQTKIARIRKCPPTPNKIQMIKDMADSASSNANFRRKVYIVISYISKVELQNAITRLKNGGTFDGKGVTLQILWFVNSLLCSANELSAEFRIVCKP